MGEPFGHYELLQPLATGGMGQLYLARNRAEGFQKLVVVKMLLAHLSRDKAFMAMFLDEARIAAQLNHPHICQIFELGEHGGAHYLAMEYVPGVDLRSLQQTLSERSQRLAPALACRVVADAASALAYAHELTDDSGRPVGLVHRDVSPSNVLVSFEGAVKLIDFGIAKATGRATATATGQLKGKFAYMSPEQAEGDPLDARSDIFALGLVLHELLTGHRVLQRDTDPGTLKAAREAAIPPPSSMNPECPLELDAVVLRALARRPEDRYATAGQFALALEEWLLRSQQPASQAHLAAFLRATYPDHKERSRARGEATPASGLDGTFVRTPSGQGPAPSGLTRTFLTPELPTAPQPAAPTEQPTRARGSRRAMGAVWVLVLALAGGAFFWLRPGPSPVATPVSAPVAVLTPVPPEPPPSPAPPPAEPAPAPTPGKVAFTLTSKPEGATVLVGGKSLGTTPLSFASPSEMPPRVEVVLKGFARKQVELKPGEGPLKEVELVRQSANKDDSPFKTKGQR